MSDGIGSAISAAAQASLGVGQTSADVTDQFQRQLLAALSNPLFNLPKSFLTYMADYVATAGLNIPAGQIVGFRQDAVRVYNKSIAPLTVSNSAAETSVVTQEIPAGSMDTTGMLRLTAFGLWTNTTGSNQNLTMKIKFGGTTIYQDTDFSATAAVRPVQIQVTIANIGANNSQMLVGFWIVGNADVPTTGRAGMVSKADRYSLIRNNSAMSVDTTTTQTLDVTVTLATASASLTFLRDYYMLEFL